MSLIRISKEFTFEMAHVLHNYNGKCANIHGHSYHLSVTIIGEPKVGENSDTGMVMDFAELKIIVEREVLSQFDHALVLSNEDPLCDLLEKQTLKVVKVNYQPTCENILTDIAQRLQPHIITPTRLHSLKLRETGSCYTEWFSSDNL